jgi:hypothetical protein
MTKPIYKFIGLNSKFGPASCDSILKESKIWVSSFRNLNDPFEFRFASSAGAGNHQYDFAVAVGNSKKGVLSFSSTNTDLLLWSHYGSAHNGVCFEFDPSHDDNFKRVRSVNYQSTMPTYDPSNPDEMLYSKSLHWKYEEEVRLIVPNNCDQYLEFKPACLKAVYFGVKVTFEDIARFDFLARKLNLKCYQADTIRNDYRLEFKESQKLEDYSAALKKAALQRIIDETIRKERVQKILNKMTMPTEPSD